jgi:hypothetical protein
LVAQNIVLISEQELTKQSWWSKHRKRLIDAGAAFSLANLCFLNLWPEQLDPVRIQFFQTVPQTQPYLQIMTANILIVGCLIFAAMSWTRKFTATPRLVAEFSFLALFLIPLNIIRNRFLHVALGFRSLRGLLALGIVIIAAGVLLYFRKPALRYCRILLLILSPFLPMAYLEASIQHWKILAAADKLPRSKSSPRLHTGEVKPIHVVWIIFDELDACMAFSRRPADVKLPMLDWLQSQSLYATNASSPAGSTPESIPSLFTGNRVEKAAAESLEELSLLYRSDHKLHRFSEQPTSFSRAYDLGFNTAVVGWFIPYCRLFPFTSCYWEPVNSVFLREDYAKYLTFTQSMWFQLSTQLVEVPGIYALDNSIGREASDRLTQARRTSRAQAISEYRHIHDHAVQAIQDPNLDFIFLHWPAPHGLFYYNRKTADFTVEDGPDYFDALALVDRTIGDIRAVLELTGNWDNNALLVSSDHPLRRALNTGAQTPELENSIGNQLCPHVPFLLKLPGQKSAFSYNRAINTVLSGELLLGVLKGELTSPQAVASWLDARSAQISPAKSIN